MGIASSGRALVVTPTPKPLLVKPKGRPSLCGQRWRHVDTLLLKQAGAFISHVHVSEGGVLLQGPTGPERQFYGIYNSTTAAFHPGLIMFCVPRSSAFSPCLVPGRPVFLTPCALGEPREVRTMRSHLPRSTLSVGGNAAGQGKKTRERSGVSQLGVGFLPPLNGRGVLLKGRGLIPSGRWYCQEGRDGELSPHHQTSR